MGKAYPNYYACLSCIRQWRIDCTWVAYIRHDIVQKRVEKVITLMAFARIGTSTQRRRRRSGVWTSQDRGWWQRNTETIWNSVMSHLWNSLQEPRKMTQTNVDQHRLWDSLRVIRPHSLLILFVSVCPVDILLCRLGPVNELLRVCVSDLSLPRWSKATGVTRRSGSSKQPMLLIGACTLLYSAKICKASSQDARLFGMESHWGPNRLVWMIPLRTWSSSRQAEWCAGLKT